MDRLTVRIVALCLILACCPGALLGAEAAAPLRVATFQSDVTLPLGDLLYALPLSTVEHPLLARGVELDDGSKRYVL